MGEIVRIVKDVDSSMTMEGMPLMAMDKERIRKCLVEPSSLDSVIQSLLSKHMVPKI